MRYFRFIGSSPKLLLQYFLAVSQRYLISRPVPAAGVAEWLRSAQRPALTAEPQVPCGPTQHLSTSKV